MIHNEDGRRQRNIRCLTVASGVEQAGRTMKCVSAKTRRWILVGGAAGGLAFCALAWWWAAGRGYDVRESVEWVLAQVRGLGPVAFFSLMALLPAAGMPVSVFTLTAGPVFAPVLGMPLVLALSLASLGVNVALTYVLARWILRPWVERLCAWLGFTIPEVAEDDQRSLVILVRVTPGPPYVLQNFLLGMAQIRFATYFTISFLVVSVYSSAVIIFGDALVNGKGKGALIGISLLVAFVIGVRFARKRLGRTKARAGAAG
jgi:uncharacterized membrane protein YdjX (TVP38/TMEM64 family)